MFCVSTSRVPARRGGVESAARPLAISRSRVCVGAHSANDPRDGVGARQILLPSRQTPSVAPAELESPKTSLNLRHPARSSPRRSGESRSHRRVPLASAALAYQLATPSQPEAKSNVTASVRLATWCDV